MPWGRLDDSLYDHPKLDELPSDPAEVERILAGIPPAALLRLAAIGLWTRAISWSNRFLTDGVVPRAKLAKLDGTTALADALAGECVTLFEKTATGYAVHDFLQFNDSRADVLERRRKEAERKAEWRRKRAGIDQPTRPDGSPNGTSSTSEPNVPQGQKRPSRDSTRARDVARIPTQTRPIPDPTHDSLTRESRARPRRPKRDDVAALLERGWPKVSRAQRRVLDEVLARHDVTGPAFAAEVIRATPADADPLAAVMDADRRWQAAQAARAEADELAWADAKGSERMAPWMDQDQEPERGPTNGELHSLARILPHVPLPEPSRRAARMAADAGRRR